MIVESFMAFMQKVFFFTSFVNNTSSFPKPLTQEEEKKYLELFHNGDMKARDILIHHNLRLVAHIIKKYNQVDEADDLISVGSLGLIKAINTYKEGHNTLFSTYAARCIENEILMLIRANKKHKNTISIEDVLATDEDDNDISIMDLASTEENLETMVENKVIGQTLDGILKSKLSKREYVIMCLRFGLNGEPMLTQQEVADKLGISRSYISRLEKKSLETLKKYVKPSDFR